MVRLSVPAQLCFRDLALAAVLAAIDAEGPGPHADVRDEIISALNEAFNNVVLHAYRGVRGGTIDLHVSAQQGQVEIAMHDRGRGFDPEGVPGYVAPELPADDAADPISLASLGRLPESGMGLFIIRSFMDDVTYTRGAGGKPNVLVLRKTWAAAAATAHGTQAESPKKETSQSGWRIRSVAVPAVGQSIAGSLKRT